MNYIKISFKSISDNKNIELLYEIDDSNYPVRFLQIENKFLKGAKIVGGCVDGDIDFPEGKLFENKLGEYDYESEDGFVRSAVVSRDDFEALWSQFSKK